jgi:hypothetical protein
MRACVALKGNPLMTMPLLRTWSFSSVIVLRTYPTIFLMKFSSLSLEGWGLNSLKVGRILK